MTLVPAAASPARHGAVRAGAALALPSAAMLTLCAVYGENVGADDEVWGELPKLVI